MVAIVRWLEPRVLRRETGRTGRIALRRESLLLRREAVLGLFQIGILVLLLETVRLRLLGGLGLRSLVAERFGLGVRGRFGDFPRILSCNSFYFRHRGFLKAVLAYLVLLALVGSLPVVIFGEPKFNSFMERFVMKVSKTILCFFEWIFIRICNVGTVLIFYLNP